VAVDLAFQRVLGRLLADDGLFHRAEGDDAAVRQDDLHADHVVGGHAVKDAVRAGGVVAADAAEHGAVVGGRVGAEHQAALGHGAVEAGQDQARLGLDPPLRRVDLQDAAQVRHIDDDRLVDRLAVQAGAAAARQDGQAIAGGGLHGGDHVFRAFGQHHGQGHDLVEAGVGAVQDAVEVIGADCALEVRAQVGGEIFNGVGLCGFHESPRSGE